MGLKEEIIAAIRREINDDPAGRGYAGKTDDEIVAMLNNPYTVESVVEEKRPARINQILTGIAGAPNAITVDDFQFAKAEE